MAKTIYYDTLNINQIVAVYDPAGNYDAHWVTGESMTRTDTATGSFTVGVDHRHHKIVANVITEMTAGEKLNNPLPGVDIGMTGPFKYPVRAATTAALQAHTRSGNVLTASGNGAFPAQDGITLTVNQRLLVKNEGGGTDLENGVYILATVGDGTHPWKLQRAIDAYSDIDVATCMTVRIQEGTDGRGAEYTLTTIGPITLNTTALTFERYENDTIRTVTTTPVTLGVNDRTLVVDATAGNATVNLPTAVGAQRNIYRVKKKDSTGNTVTIDPNGAETIDGLSTKILTTQNQSVNFQSDGTEWWIL